MANPRISGVVIGIILLHLFQFSSLVSSDELLIVVGETRELSFTPTLEVKHSPGLNRTALCERIRFQGLPRFRHIDKYAYSLKLIVNASVAIDVCFHRNMSRAIGMCPQYRWEKVSKGSWVQTMSPFDHKVLDLRIAGSSTVTLAVSAVEEFSLYRIYFLIFGTVLVISASALSRSRLFYYTCGMFACIILFMTLVLFQGTKLLPSGRSMFGLFIYSSLLGLGGFLLGYIPTLFQSLLTEMGFEEEMYFQVAAFVGSLLALSGSFFGMWTVENLVLTEDGSIDIGTSLFVCWSIRILAVVLIFQSSGDTLLAVGSLITVILMPWVFTNITRLEIPLRVYETPLNLLINIWEAIRHAEVPAVAGYLHDFMQNGPDASEFSNGVNFSSPSGGISGFQQSPRSESDTFPSSYHKTSVRSKRTKEEWRKLTEDSTTKAVRDLVSSPDFNKWAAANKVIGSM